MAKSPLILPNDPSFYELPPPPGSEPARSFESMLTEAVSLSREEPDERDRTKGEPAAPEGPLLPGACDAHVQVIGDPERFPLRKNVAKVPEFAPAEDYARLGRRLGLDRAVLVQPVVYGFDHACLLDALERLDKGADGSTGHARGVAMVSPETSDRELRGLDAAGCMAALLPMLETVLPVDWTVADRLVAGIHDTVGWDVELQMDGRFLAEVEQRLLSWPGRVILDHAGCFLGPIGDRDPGVRALLRLIDADKVWVKLAGPEESSADRARRGERPRYRDVERIARLLIRFAPERLVWGSNWPHPSANENVDDGWLLDLLGEWTEDDGIRRRILVDNAAELFRFPAMEAQSTSNTR